MDSRQSSSQQSSLDSLRTVEFRQTLRGYHIDDVDEYLERVAVDAEALQEQVRQAGDRLRAGGRAHRPTRAGAAADGVPTRTVAVAATAVGTDAGGDRRHTAAHASAGAEVRGPDRKPKPKPRPASTRGRRRGAGPDECWARPSSGPVGHRGHRAAPARGDHTTRVHPRRSWPGMSRRSRAISTPSATGCARALSDMLTWVDEHVQPAASLLAQPSPVTEIFARAPTAHGVGAVAGESTPTGSSSADRDRQRQP